MGMDKLARSQEAFWDKPEQGEALPPLEPQETKERNSFFVETQRAGGVQEELPTGSCWRDTPTL